MNRGFALCMIDYYLNIRAKSSSKAPFNMWPHKLKFALTNPKLIYRSIIKGDGSIDTQIFPTLNNCYYDNLLPLQDYSTATTLTPENIGNAIHQISPDFVVTGNKNRLLATLEILRNTQNISNTLLCNLLADAIYMPAIKDQTDKLPDKILNYYNSLISN